jgi:hypothetical protein
MNFIYPMIINQIGNQWNDNVDHWGLNNDTFLESFQIYSTKTKKWYWLIHIINQVIAILGIENINNSILTNEISLIPSKYTI